MQCLLVRQWNRVPDLKNVPAARLHQSPQIGSGLRTGLARLRHEQWLVVLTPAIKAQPRILRRPALIESTPLMTLVVARATSSPLILNDLPPTVNMTK